MTNVLASFAHPKFAVRSFEWLIAAIAVLGTLAVVSHAYLEVPDAAVRVQAILHGTYAILVTLAAGLGAGALHSLACEMESSLPGPRQVASAA
jgi:hypothetical protein